LDDSGYVKTTYTYDPFGNVTVSGESSDNPFQYTGRENDGTGLYYYRARYYSPELQRFISEDPLSFSQVLLLKQNPFTFAFAKKVYSYALRNPHVLNKYPYTTNNPLMYTDPYGLINWGKVGTGVTAQVGGYISVAIGIGTIAAGISEGGIGAVHSISPGLTTIGAGVALWTIGTGSIYEGFAELDNPPK